MRGPSLPSGRSVALILAAAWVFLGSFSGRAASSEKKALFAQAYQDALVAFHRKDWRAAEAAVDRARQIDPDDPQGWVLTARILLRKKEYEGARTNLQEALRRKPQFAPALRVSGDLAFDQRRFAEAFRLYNEALLREPGDKNLILKMLYCQVMLGNRGAAERLLAQLSPFDESNPAYYFGEAAIFHARDREPRDQKDLLQTARVMYGNDVFAEYLSDYEFLFADPR
ncbi:tetratricopeptide repeat protein [Methylacidimicrobium sp. B4]|uniref:tetratricopeptide repeat protein n=1 Tax=Methylacidimicrobium sp. B4 TaxID=2796139 RepID=UPI001A9056B1|nr:tetratricopeptide repeat protein [Methylacidimicrobium sp. B4]QSR84267.1 tetratricopeptide repeat protein [Methylacidimicrobium sp. B4]